MVSLAEHISRFSYHVCEISMLFISGILRDKSVFDQQQGAITGVRMERSLYMMSPICLHLIALKGGLQRSRGVIVFVSF